MNFMEKFKAGAEIGVKAKANHFSSKLSEKEVCNSSEKWIKKKEKEEKKVAKKAAKKHWQFQSSVQPAYVATEKHGILSLFHSMK